MTTNTPAPAHEAVLTPEERAAAIAHLTDRDTFTARDIAIERAVLSKLRAPVADERERGYAENAAFRIWWDENQACPEHSLTTENAAHAAWQERGRRAALASAPVAGEAQDIKRTIAEAIGFGFGPGETQTVNAHDLLFLAEVLRGPNAAPQASEAVRMDDLKAVAREVAADSAAIRAEARNAALEEAAAAVLDDEGDSLASHAANRHAAARIRALKSQPHNSDSRSAVESSTCADDVALPPLPPADLMADPGGDAWPFPKSAYFKAATMIAYARAALSAQPGAQKESRDE